MSDALRLCPKCDRRVPRTVAKCRCGAVMPAEEVAAADETPRQSPILGYLVLIAAVAGVGYWTFMQPPAQTPGSAVTDANDAAAQPGDAETTSPRPRELSPEQRAWDAAARTQVSRPAIELKDEEPIPLGDPGLTPALEDMVDRALPSIVLVEATGGRGSAFFVRHDTLITNVHVVQQDGYV